MPLNLETTLEDISRISHENFEEQALAVFRYQYEHIEVYHEYCNLRGVTNPSQIQAIPFLPIQFFKSHKILPRNADYEQIFKSSGTTIGKRSQHFVVDLKRYESSFFKTFNDQVIDPKEAVIIALLPNYLEQGNSSLVYMVDALIKATDHPYSGFYLSQLENIGEVIRKAKATNRKVILFGVSFALLDLAEQNMDLSGVLIIETGGMKGRRKEITREELHDLLMQGLNVENISSEYGMTELLSQAYLGRDGFFSSPAWMKVLIRDVNDPLSYLDQGKTGGVNVIDLANLYSCSFIATDDLGLWKNDKFKILGRFDQSDIRGCNLLVN
jgi:phenylacetate-coenzyme A ligase PaaK-like adenylate-forming protein